jgi:hypothetical protein
MPFRYFALLCLLVVTNTYAAKPATDTATSALVVAPQMQESISRLQEIREALQEKRAALDLVQRELRKTKEETAVATLKAEQEELLKAIAKLNQSFEQVATGGVDTALFVEQPVPEFDWKKELIVVTKPLLDSLKELTEKPRRIDNLRNEIMRLENLQKVTQQARQAIATMQEQPLSDSVKEKMDAVAKSWEKREADIAEALEMAKYQLNSLHAQKNSPLGAIVNSLQEFFQGRGVTLLIAAGAVLSIWLLMKLLQKLLFVLYRPRGQQHKTRLRLLRIARYVFMALTGALALFAIITVFYARNDVLLLVLVIVIILMLLLSLRTALPRYIAEIRMLLNIGPVRQDERVIYNGVPYHVRTISVYSTLTNPELDGVIRLPSDELNSLISRPRTEEPWFPCCPGEYVMLPGDVFAEVIKQSVETVQLKIKGCPVNMPTADFLSSGIRNLSREGFVVIVIFGVDYQHQAECLSRIPDTFRSAISAAFEQYEHKPTDLLVEFSTAGANSLDYLIVASMPGSAAASYFGIGRMIQRTCVAVCNRENWVIPFQQLTIHQGEGFASLTGSANQE